MTMQHVDKPKGAENLQVYNMRYCVGHIMYGARVYTVLVLYTHATPTHVYSPQPRIHNRPFLVPTE